MILLVTYTAKPHCREAFLRAVQENSLQEIVRQEDGCLEYAYYAAVADAEKILAGGKMGIGGTAADTPAAASHAAAEAVERTVHCRNGSGENLIFCIFIKNTCFFFEKSGII